MNIENYRAKRKENLTSLEFAESGRIGVYERRYDQTTGVPTMGFRGETDSRQQEGEVEQAKQRLDAEQARYDDALAFAADIKAKEQEREKIQKENEKKK